MKGFGVRYLCTLASRNLSGSNFRAMDSAVLVYVSALEELARTVWAPEIRAAVNVHHNVDAAVWEDKLPFHRGRPQTGKNVPGICWDVNRWLTVLGRQNHGFGIGPRIDWARTTLRIVLLILGVRNTYTGG